MRDREGTAWATAVIAIGFMALFLVQDTTRQPILEDLANERISQHVTRRADSLMVYLFSAESDTVWSITVPAQGMQEVDAFGVEWWAEDIHSEILWAGWHGN